MDSLQQFLDISLLSWNIRGASNDNAKRHIKDLIRKHKPDIIFIMETHIPFDRVKTFWQRAGYHPIHIVEAQGHSGGLWALVQVGLNLSISVWEFSNHSITLEVNSGNQKWLCSGIYASPNATSRELFWQHLCNLSLSIISPWFLVGDWNEILLPGEQKGCIFSASRAAAFWNVLDTCGLLDINTTGGNLLGTVSRGTN